MRDPRGWVEFRGKPSDGPARRGAVGWTRRGEPVPSRTGGWTGSRRIDGGPGRRTDRAGRAGSGQGAGATDGREARSTDGRGARSTDGERERRGDGGRVRLAGAGRTGPRAGQALRRTGWAESRRGKARSDIRLPCRDHHLPRARLLTRSCLRSGLLVRTRPMQRKTRQRPLRPGGAAGVKSSIWTENPPRHQKTRPSRWVVGSRRALREPGARPTPQHRPPRRGRPRHRPPRRGRPRHRPPGRPTPQRRSPSRPTPRHRPPSRSTPRRRPPRGGAP